MARKSVIKPFQLISNGDLTATSVTSNPTNIENLDGAAYMISYANLTGNGSFTVEASVWDGSPIDTRIWATLDLDAIAIDSTSATSGTFIINLTGLMFEQVRLKYTKGTATVGTFNVWLTGKQVGG